MHQTVGAFAVGKRRLQRVAIGWQCFGNDIGELNLTEHPAPLLVGQNILQTQNITGQLFDICLGLVDGGKAFLQFCQALGRFLG